jgi:hypothetical protein
MRDGNRRARCVYPRAVTVTVAERRSRGAPARSSLDVTVYLPGFRCTVSLPSVPLSTVAATVRLPTGVTVTVAATGLVGQRPPAGAIGHPGDISVRTRIPEAGSFELVWSPA